MVRRADTSHKAILDDMVYPAILLAFGQSIAHLLMMVGCIQSRLRALTKKFCKVEALVDDNVNVLIDQHSNPEVKAVSYTHLTLPTKRIV